MVTLSSLQPYVRYVRDLDKRTGMYGTSLIPYDCRLFYIRQGAGTLRFSFGDIPIRTDDLILWPSGMQYCVTESDDAMLISAVNFDLTPDRADLPFPIPPARPTAFVSERLITAPEIADFPLDRPIVMHQAHFAGLILKEMLREYERARKWMRPMLAAKMQELLILLARQENPNRESRIDEMLAYIRLHSAEPLTNEQLGERFGFHPNALNRIFVTHTGLSLHQYLLNDRLRRAVGLLESTDLAVATIAETVGFEDSGYFSRLFREKIGCTPLAYRKGGSGAPSGGWNRLR